MSNYKKTIPALLGAGAMMLALASPVMARDVTLKFANVGQQAGKEAGKIFKQVVEEETDGTVKVNLFPDNQLGDDRVALESTIFGDVDIAVATTSPLATIIPDLYVFDTPYLFLNADEVNAGLSGETGQEILNGLSVKGLKGLAYWENGFRDLTNSKKDVRVPDDLTGLKIRTMENDVHLAAWKAFGASPTPMAGTEIFTALQQGTVDGQENSLGVIDGLKFNEPQDYLSITEHVYVPYILVMNLDKFNSLTPEQQTAIEKAAAESAEFQQKRSAELEAAILEEFQETMSVTILTPEDKQLWRQKIIDSNIADMVKAKMEHPEYLDQFMGN